MIKGDVCMYCTYVRGGASGSCRPQQRLNLGSGHRDEPAFRWIPDLGPVPSSVLPISGDYRDTFATDQGELVINEWTSRIDDKTAARRAARAPGGRAAQPRSGAPGQRGGS